MYSKTQLPLRSYSPMPFFERLGVLEFKVPNLVAHSSIDTLSVPTSPTPGGLRKTAKCITFCDPLINLDQPHNTPYTQGLIGLRKQSSCKVSFQDFASTIKGTKCKSPSSTTSQLHPALK